VLKELSVAVQRCLREETARSVVEPAEQELPTRLHALLGAAVGGRRSGAVDGE